MIVFLQAVSLWQVVRDGKSELVEMNEAQKLQYRQLIHLLTSYFFTKLSFFYFLIIPLFLSLRVWPPFMCLCLLLKTQMTFEVILFLFLSDYYDCHFDTAMITVLLYLLFYSPFYTISRIFLCFTYSHNYT
jgi:hypothetical protein